MLRNYGNTKFYTGYKFSNGIIRLNHRLLEFSDRDVARFESPFGIRPLGRRVANRKLIETCDNFKPDLILIGHCDIIRENTLREIRELLPQTKIAHWFLDALWNDRNIDRLNARANCVDSIFITTGGEALKQFCSGKNRVAFIPNPTDPAWESHNNAKKTKFERDLVFCGVGAESDDRYELLDHLKNEIGDSLRFETYGLMGAPPAWGQAYDAILASSKMALNLNREEGWPLYSSDRLSQLIGNGLLTFMWDKADMRRLFNDDQVAFFRDKEELVRKIKQFHEDERLRQSVASNGHQRYHERFSAQRVMQFIIETTFELPFSHEYPWKDEIYSLRSN